MPMSVTERFQASCPTPPETGFTVFLQEITRTGTMFITHMNVQDIEQAKSAALAECADAWDMDEDKIDVVGVAEGDVHIVEWDD